MKKAVSCEGPLKVLLPILLRDMAEEDIKQSL
jgi:hypothetical protein